MLLHNSHMKIDLIHTNEEILLQSFQSSKKYPGHTFKFPLPTLLVQKPLEKAQKVTS